MEKEISCDDVKAFWNKIIDEAGKDNFLFFINMSDTVLLLPWEDNLFYLFNNLENKKLDSYVKRRFTIRETAGASIYKINDKFYYVIFDSIIDYRKPFESEEECMMACDQKLKENGFRLL